MEFGSVITVIIVGAIAGWLAGIIVRGIRLGLFGNIIVGVVGAFIASLLFPALGFTAGGGFFASVLHATIGAVIFLFTVKLIRRAS